MIWGEKYDKIIKRNQDIGVKEFVASKTSPTCVLVQYRDDRYRCTFCGNVVVGDSRYCPRCGAWNKSYDSKFYDLYDSEDDDCEEEMNNESKDTKKIHVDCDTMTDILYALRDKDIPMHSPKAYKFVAEEYGYTQENSDISL